MSKIKTVILLMILILFASCGKNTIDDIDERIIWYEFDCNNHAHVESFYTEMQNYNPVISEEISTYSAIKKFIKNEKKKKRFKKNMKVPYYKTIFLGDVVEIKVFTDDEKLNFIQTYFYEDDKLARIEKIIGNIKFVTLLIYTDDLSIIKHAEFIDGIEIAAIERDVIREVVLNTSRVDKHDELLNQAFEDWNSDKGESKFMHYGVCP